MKSLMHCKCTLSTKISHTNYIQLKYYANMSSRPWLDSHQLFSGQKCSPLVNGDGGALQATLG